MNLYLRYFDRETLVPTVDEAIEFLSSIDEIEMNPLLEADIREYASSDVFYPKRYKVHPRVYFIIIKTEAATMQDFKDKKAVHSAESNEQPSKVTPTLMRLNEINRDTQFAARVKAFSGMECYERMIDYLRDRVDSRSQFPSPKGKNFKFRFLGKAK